MEILLTNDDGIYAPGLAAMEQELNKLGNVTVVSPATEQSGVAHSITFLSPLICKEQFQGEHRRGWAVEGSPADCVKIGIFEFCDPHPDIIVSGINGGLNAGINVLYSGTVAAAIEGAFFGTTSIAVSLEYDEHAQFDKAADRARQIIEKLLKQKEDKPQLFNINIPTAALEKETEVVVVPMGLSRYGEHYLKRVDPRGRDYYWATGDPPPEETEHETDLSALKKGLITVTPLHFDMTQKQELGEMESWDLQISD